MKRRDLVFHKGVFSKTFIQNGILFSPTSAYVPSRCVCVLVCDWACLHCNDAFAAMVKQNKVDVDGKTSATWKDLVFDALSNNKGKK